MKTLVFSRVQQVPAKDLLHDAQQITEWAKRWLSDQVHRTQAQGSADALVLFYDGTQATVQWQAAAEPTFPTVDSERPADMSERLRASVQRIKTRDAEALARLAE